MGKKKIYRSDVSLGIQLAESPVQGTGYLRNMTLENGVAKKRKGWRTLFNFRGYSYEPHRVNGIYEYRGRDGAFLLVHAEKNIYRCSYDFREIEKIPCQEGVAIEDKRSRGQMYGGVMWITGMGEPLIYDGHKIKAVRNTQLCYAPVTARKIRDKKLYVPYEKNEEPNMMSGKRINTIHVKKDSLLVHRFLLDSTVKYGTPFKIKASFRVKKSEEEADDLTTDYVGVLEDGNEVNTVVSIELYTDCVEEAREIVSREKPLDKMGRSVSIGEGFVFLAHVSNGNELYLAFDAAAYENGVDNVEVEFTADTEDGCFDKIGDVCTVGLSGGGDALALATDTGKILIGGLKNGKFYFPEDKAFTVGAEAEPVTAVLPRAQSSVAVYKENGFYVLNLNGEKETEVLPSPEMLGCFCPFSATRQRDECLALSVEGIYGIKDSVSKTNVSTFQKMRSEGIQAELDRIPVQTLENGVACVHKGRYYLFLNDRAYVMQREEKGDGVVWWRFDNCAARVALCANGSLYMGRENGDVAVFDEEYTDRRDYVLNERERDFLFQNVQGKTTVSLNYAIGVEVGDTLYIGEHYALWSTGYLDSKTSLIHLSAEDCYENGLYVGLCQGDRVLLCDGTGYVIYEGEVVDFTPSSYTVYCGNLGQGEDTELSIYVKRDERTEYTYEIKKGLGYLCHKGRDLTLYNVEIDRVYVRHKEEIECELYTPVTDMGEYRQKNLVGFNLTLTPETRCALEVGYETGAGFYRQGLSLGGRVDFCAMDFNAMSFYPKFERTIRARCLERNVDYVRLYLRSEKGADFGVEGVSLLYTVIG